MESTQAVRVSEQRWRRRKFLLAALCALVLLLSVVVVCVSVSDTHIRGQLERTVRHRCEQYVQKSRHTYSGNICQDVWHTFMQAFVGQDPCHVGPEAYDPLIQRVGVSASCDRLLFWSKAKEISHEFTRSTSCMYTLEDTLLGFIADSLTWCGKNNSNEISTSGCPNSSYCENNPVSSYWKRVSASFAQSACGNATVMLNGSITEPFNQHSIFGSVEVKNFNSSKLSGLTVVLVTGDPPNVTCGDSSLQQLQNLLDPKLKYICKEVKRSSLLDCFSTSGKVCGRCW